MTEPAQTPVNIFAAHPVLGKYLSHHPSRRFMLLVQAAIFYAIPTGILQLLTLNIDDQTAAQFVPFAFAAFGVAAAWYVLHFWNREVVLYEKGFSYQRGSVTAYFRYENIITMRQSIEKQSFMGFSRMVYNYLLITDMDEELAINNLYSNTEKLTRSLDALIARDRLPHIRQMLADGRDVPFSEGFRLSREGLFYGESELFWHEFSAYRIQNSKLILQSKTNPEWAAIPLKSINNPPLLLALLKERVKNKDDAKV